jgi:hypothetical protein
VGYIEVLIGKLDDQVEEDVLDAIHDAATLSLELGRPMRCW